MFNDAKWIKSPVPCDKGCEEFYRKIEIKKDIERATLTASAAGMYIPYLNGERIGDALFAPGWTQYTARVQYQTYEINGLKAGENELCILCGEGWAIGEIAFSLMNHNMSDHKSIIYSLDVTYTDGTKESFVSDENTTVRSSYIVHSQIYDGDIIDATRKKEEFGHAVVDPEEKPTLVPQQCEAVREQERIRPAKYFVAPNGERIIDFGQNLAGYVEIRMSAPRGARLTISHAEILDRDGNFYTKNLRTAKEQCSYTFAGSGEECFHPLFSWQGFRYIRIDEYPFDEVDPDAFTAVAVHTDMKRTGYFECGNKKINQLYHNIIWGQKSNYIDIPTDCPQRDERLAWTGDAQVFVRTAAINYDVERFFIKWLADLAIVQDDHDGGVVGFAPLPKIAWKSMRCSAAWGDAAVICPWEVYLAYGNTEILERQYESMHKWIEFIHRAGDEEFLWLGGGHYGDWLAMDGGSEEGLTPKDFIASCYYAHSTSLFVKAGEALDKDMSEYRELHKNIVNALHDRFFENGLPVCRTQTAYALAIHFGLCTDEKKTADGLAELIRENGGKLNTGFVGTPCLLHALTKGGYSDLAYNLWLEEGFPSWLYSVNLGATTMWEHWDGMRADGTMWSDAMNSFNHYAYGAVYDWIFGVCAGIKCLEDGAGYKHVSVRPYTDERLGHLRASIETRHGKLESAWYYKNDMICFEIDIPDGTTAEIELPNGFTETVGKGKYLYSIAR